MIRKFAPLVKRQIKYWQQQKFLIALTVLCWVPIPALAQSAITLPIAANAVADLGNGPVKVRMIAGNASIFTSQGSGVGSTSGSSTTLTLTTTPATPPIIGGLISGNGVTSGTTITAYNGTTGITLSAAMTVPASTSIAWSAACSSSVPNAYIQASASASYYIMYTQARVCAVSPGGPVNTLLIDPVYYDSSNQIGALPQTIAGVSHEWLNSYTASTGLFGQTQPAFSDISGTATAAQIPLPTASTIGGIESITSLVHNWISYIDTSGVPHQSQPAFSDLSGLAVPSQLPAAPLATGSSTGNTLTGPYGYFICTAVCTVTPPVPSAGLQFCVMNDDNTSGVITLGALGSSARYENTARTAYGTAGTGTLASGGAVGDMICVVGRDSTHYLSPTFVGTWTAS